MFYHLFELGQAAMRPARVAADGYRIMLNHPLNPLTHTTIGRSAAAACEVFERTTRRYEKPEFGISSTVVAGETVPVTEDVVWRRPFCRLIYFRRDIPEAVTRAQPRVLLVAPMSGHFATLLRGTVETFLPDHEVYITDWTDARDVPAAAADFDLDDYIDYMADIFRHFGGDVHVFAVCQPSVPVLAAVASMEAAGDRCVPHSLTLAGGPIDTRVSPTVVNRLAVEKGTEWFRRNVIATVPWNCRGAGRRVYPGFLQLSGFMTMNLDRHMKAHKDFFFHLVKGDGDSAEKHKDFYDEYLAVMDLTAEFYLQTIERVFVEHQMARGVFTHRNRRIDLSAIRNVALMTVEGENDDITGIGQCSAAIDLCTGIPARNKQHFECPQVGHYGIFNGSRFRKEIAPRMSAFMRRFDPRTVGAPTLAETAPAPSRGRDPDEAAAFSFPHRAPAAPAAPAAVVADEAGSGAAANAPAPSASAPAMLSPFAHFLPLGITASTAAFQLWSLAGRVMLDSMTRARADDPA
ncbi:MAG: polyhydroxyalkanoate depolymerase [Hyphomicrobiales bacterium]|nr:polyhydroxyalkanoate depolymerase [Hyphomicrobiales bacterium]